MRPCVWEDLQRDLAVEARVLRRADEPNPAAGELGKDLVGTEGGS